MKVVIWELPYDRTSTKSVRRAYTPRAVFAEFYGTEYIFVFTHA